MHMCGGPKDANPHDPAVVSIAEYLVGQLNTSNEPNIASLCLRPPVVLVSIKTATTQVVAGINYVLCIDIQTEGDVQGLKAKVYHRPWGDSVTEISEIALE